MICYTPSNLFSLNIWKIKMFNRRNSICLNFPVGINIEVLNNLCLNHNPLNYRHLKILNILKMNLLNPKKKKKTLKRLPIIHNSKRLTLNSQKNESKKTPPVLL